MLTLSGIVPGHRFYERVARLLGVLVELLEPAPEVEDKPGVAPGIFGRLDGLVVPLQHALGLGKGAVLLGDQGAGHEEDLGGALLRVHPVHLPRGRRLDLIGVQDNEPVEVSDAVAGEPRVRPSDGEVLPKDEATLYPAVLHAHDHSVVGVVAGDAREVVEELARLGVEGLAIPGLHLAGDVLGEVVQPPRGGGLRLHVVLPRVVRLVHVRHRQVAGEDVVEGGYVRRALDRGVAPQGHDPSARTSYVPQEELQDGGGADDLDPLGVLGPADRVAEGRRLLAPGVLTDRLGDLQEGLLRTATDLLDHLRGVLGKVAFEDLEDAPLVLEARVVRAPGLHRRACSPDFLALDATLAPPDGRVVDGRSLVAPARHVVRLRLHVPAGEEARLAHVLKLLGNEGGSVGVVDYVFSKVLLVLYDIVYEATEERYVRPRPDRRIQVAHRTRTREAWVDVDELRTLLAGDHGVPKAHRVGLGHVRALDNDAVGVLQVHEVGGGAAPTVRDAQTGHRGAVSYTRLVGDLGKPHGVEQLGDEVILLVVYRRAADGGDRKRAVELPALLVCLLKGLVARPLDPVGDHIHRLVQGELLPLLGVGPTVLDLGPAVRRVDHPEGRRALGAQGAGVYRAVGVTLNVYDASVPAIDECRATHRAVGADAYRLLHAGVARASPQVAGRRAYGVLHLHADVVLDLGPQPVSVTHL